MGQINLYKVDPKQKSHLLSMLNKNYGVSTTRNIEKSGITYTLSFYYLFFEEKNPVSWEWVFKEFKVSIPTVQRGPRGIVIIENPIKDLTYAVTFGMSFFLIDKYCDKDFGFEYACRIPYEKISLTALTNPFSIKNKTINSFIKNKRLEFDSGESFAKIKGKIKPSDVDDCIKPGIEIGSAIKFQIKKDSLELIIELIIYVEKTLEQDKITKIPVFKKVKESALINKLQQHLIQHLQKKSPNILISEFGVIGTIEVFNRSDEYILKYQNIKEQYSELTLENISQFCVDYDITDPNNILNIKISFVVDGTVRNTTSLLELLDYMDDEERCLLINGIWYEFNSDYLETLRDSLSEISVFNFEKYDLKDSQLKKFRIQKAEEEKCNQEYANKTPDEIQKAINKKYYKERSYNLMREADGFQRLDRITKRIGSSDFEPMDLYKDNTMFAVKFGKSSGDLSYVVTQSMMSLKAIKEGLIADAKSIKNVAIWLVLERKEKIAVRNGHFDWDQLNMLILKNQISQWKKEVLLAGYQPQVYINYRIEEC